MKYTLRFLGALHFQVEVNAAIDFVTSQLLFLCVVVFSGFFVRNMENVGLVFSYFRFNKGHALHMEKLRCPRALRVVYILFF